MLRYKIISFFLIPQGKVKIFCVNGRKRGHLFNFHVAPFFVSFTSNPRAASSLRMRSEVVQIERPHIRNLKVGKGQGLLMSPTQGQAYIIGGNPIPAISKNLKAFLYGWLPLSDAAGIIIVNSPTASFPC
jgi:hypothetical protein